MQVVQPNPTTAKPSWASGASRFARSRYEVTTFDPGASEVFTCGGTARPRSSAFRAMRPAPTITFGLEVFVQLGDRRDDHGTVADGGRVGRRAGLRRMVLPIRFERALERERRIAQRDAFVRVPRTGEGRNDAREVDGDPFVVIDRSGFGRAPESGRPGVRLDPRDERRVAARAAEIRRGRLIDGEERRGRAVLGAHVRDRRAVRDREVRDAGTVEFHEPVDDPLLPELAGHGEHEVGRGRALGEEPVSSTPTTTGTRQEVRLSEHHGLGLDPADAKAEDGDAVHHRGVGVGTDDGVRERDRSAVLVAARDDRREVLEVDLVADPVPRRDDARVRIRAFRPTKEEVPLVVPLVLSVEVDRQRAGGPEAVDLDGVVDDEVDRDDWVHPFARDPSRDRGTPQHRKVDDDGDTGEILEEDAFRIEREFGLFRDRLAVREGNDRGEVGTGGVVVANDVLEEDPDGLRPTRVFLGVDAPDPFRVVDQRRVGTEARRFRGSEAIGRAHARGSQREFLGSLAGAGRGRRGGYADFTSTLASTAANPAAIAPHAPTSAITGSSIVR